MSTFKTVWFVFECLRLPDYRAYSASFVTYLTAKKYDSCALIISGFALK